MPSLQKDASRPGNQLESTLHLFKDRSLKKYSRRGINVGPIHPHLLTIGMIAEGRVNMLRSSLHITYDIPLEDYEKNAHQLHNDLLRNNPQDLYDFNHNFLSFLKSPMNAVPTRRSALGEAVEEAMNNTEFTDHNFNHLKRVEELFKELMYKMPEYYSKQLVHHPWLMDAGFLVVTFHDIDQLLRMQRNSQHDDSPQLSVKQGHGLGAAAMILALTQKYAIANGISLAQAQKITSAAAVMMMTHERPEDYASSQRAQTAPYEIHEGKRVYFYGRKLYTMYIQNRIDLGLLTTRQVMELLIYEKKQRKIGSPSFITSKTPYGLDPYFEEEYRNELRFLYSRNRPLLETELQTVKEKKLFRFVAETTLFADIADMIAPPTEAIIRSLQTQFSLARPFVPQELNQEKILKQILTGRGNIQEGDSDLRRLLWEYIHAGESFRGSSVIEYDPAFTFLKENIITGILTFEKIFTRIIQGDRFPFDHAYEQRIKQQTRKYLRLSGMNETSVLEWFEKNSSLSSEALIAQATQTIAQRSYQALRDSYIVTIGTISEERRRIADIIQKKRPESVSAQRREDEVRFFQEVVKNVKTKLIRQYHVSDEEFATYETMAEEGTLPPSIPASSYDIPDASKNVSLVIENVLFNPPQ